jgi:hypothetical protein
VARPSLVQFRLDLGLELVQELCFIAWHRQLPLVLVARSAHLRIHDRAAGIASPPGRPRVNPRSARPGHAPGRRAASSGPASAGRTSSERSGDMATAERQARIPWRPGGGKLEFVTAASGPTR